MREKECFLKKKKKDRGDARGDDRGGYDKTQECTGWRKRQIRGSRNVQREEKLTNLNLESSRLDVTPPFFFIFRSSRHRRVRWEKARRCQRVSATVLAPTSFNGRARRPTRIRANTLELMLWRSAPVLYFARRPLTDLVEST